MLTTKKHYENHYYRPQNLGLQVWSCNEGKIVIMGRSTFATTEESTHESIKHEVDGDCFLWLLWSCSSRINATRSDSQQGVLRGSFKAFMGRRSTEEAELWKTRAWTTTVHQVTRLCSLANKATSPSPSSILSSRLFLISQLKIILKGSCFQSIDGIQEKSLAQLQQWEWCTGSKKYFEKNKHL